MSQNRPWLVVAEHEVVPMSESWDGLPTPTNARLLREAGWCKTCGFGPHPGSLLYCPDCHRSGSEHKLDAQRQLVGYPDRGTPPPPPNRASRATVEKVRRVAKQVTLRANAVTGPTRRQRRQALYSPDSADPGAS